MNDEVIAKKYSMRVLLIVLGIILLVLSVISLVALIISGRFSFLLPCVGMGIGGALVIAMVGRNEKLPKDLIVANDTGFVIVEKNIQIPYQAVCSVDAKYNYRRIIITMQDGFKFVINYVADYKQVKLNIARKVKEKTGRDIRGGIKLLNRKELWRLFKPQTVSIITTKQYKEENICLSLMNIQK